MASVACDKDDEAAAHASLEALVVTSGSDFAPPLRACLKQLPSMKTVTIPVRLKENKGEETCDDRRAMIVVTANAADILAHHHPTRTYDITLRHCGKLTFTRTLSLSVPRMMVVRKLTLRLPRAEEVLGRAYRSPSVTGTLVHHLPVVDLIPLVLAFLFGKQADQ